MRHLDERVPGIVAMQLGALSRSGFLPPELTETEVPREGTPVYDLDGAVLFERVVLNGGTYADLAVAPEAGAPLMAVTKGDWQPETLIEQATAALGKHMRKPSYDESRFVAYSFPKIAVQFLDAGQEVALVECYTGILVPREAADDNFKRIPFKDGLGKGVARRRATGFTNTLATVPGELQRIHRWSPLIRVDSDWFEPIIRRLEVKEPHYSTRGTDHAPCYELRGQETNVWCADASVQMMLDFYRYNYTQDRLATELGLGTRQDPNGLPYSRDGDVVTVLEHLTSKALVAGMNTTPNFAEFVTEARANRPVISFIPGHSRTVAGFVNLVPILPVLGFQGLLVYDPWPPNAGVITRWENFAATTYRVTFTAHVIPA
ncbi:MAG TPA: C39 family peptidase [Streptosporangiaceae bacterium]|nr:C39 family peptidase [Streptosporangiaceae bacterium]